MAIGKGVKALFAYSTIGLQLAITILVFIYIGYKLDKHYGTNPWFVVAGTALGMTVGFYNLIRGLSQIENISKGESEEKEERKKWL